MKYLCQLRNGYMLAVTDDKKTFGVVKTGYPYPDTDYSSQEMLDKLLKAFRIKDCSEIITVSELADVLEEYFDKNIEISHITFKQLLKTGKLDLSFDGINIFFECNFFSIYWVDEISTSGAYKAIQNRARVIGDSSRANSALILHIHKGVQTFKVSSSRPNEIVKYWEDFKAQFVERMKWELEPMQRCLDTIYDHLDEIKVLAAYFNKDHCEEGFRVFPIHYTPNFKLDIPMYGLVSTIREYFNSWEYYKIGRAKTITKSLEDIFGYDVFAETNQPGYVETFKLGAQLLEWGTSETLDRDQLRYEIERLVLKLVKKQSIYCSKWYYIVENGDIILLASPYIYFARTREVEFDGTFVTGTQKLELREMDDGRKFCAINLASISDGLMTDYESRLYQYFFLRHLSKPLESIIEYYGTVDEEQYKGYNNRNVLCAIKPNFTRLLMMGAYEETNVCKIALEVYGFRGFGKCEIKNYIPAVENAAQLSTDLTDAEKVFILCMPSYIAGIMRRKCVLKFPVNKDSIDRNLLPEISNTFLEKLKPVFRVYLLSNYTSSRWTIERYLEEFEFYFDYKMYTFSAQFLERLPV